MYDYEKIEGAVTLKKGITKEQITNQLKPYAFSGIKLTFVEFRQLTDTWEDRVEMHIFKQDASIDHKNVEDILERIRSYIDDGCLDHVMRMGDFRRYIFDRKNSTWQMEIGKIISVS